MNDKPLNPAVIAAVIVVAIVLIGFIGWHFMSGSRTSANGVDLSTSGVQPASAQGADTKH